MDPHSLLDFIGDIVAAAGEPVALRSRTRLEPIAGDRTPAMPPTYPVDLIEGKPPPFAVATKEGGAVGYAHGNRRHPDTGEVVTSVLIDSIAAQRHAAHRHLARLHAAGELPIPVLRTVVPFGDDASMEVTSFTAPHGPADAIWRDSYWPNGQRWFEHAEGSALRLSTPDDASAMYRLFPSALAYGWWFSRTNDIPQRKKDNPDPRSVLSAAEYTSLQQRVRANSGEARRSKQSRAYESSVWAFNAVPAAPRASSRIDPLGLGRLQADGEGDGGHPRLTAAGLRGESGPEGAKDNLSSVGHSNITPKLVAGGVIADVIVRTATLSFATLRQLRFGADRDPARDASGRAVAALLALVGDAYASNDAALRSGCVLVGQGTVRDLRMPGGVDEKFEASPSEILGAYRLAVERAAGHGLEFPDWPDSTFDLDPTELLKNALAVTLTEPKPKKGKKAKGADAAENDASAENDEGGETA